MPPDYAIHSDLLVYWTGGKPNDIEEQCGTANWYNDGDSKGVEKKEPFVTKYLARLTSILEHGLWMTNLLPPCIGTEYKLPEAACTCFTELKLSQSRHHAARYGRLGLGFKRPFLFYRGGRPMTYYGRKDENAWTEEDRFLKTCASDLQDKRLMHFFQPMNSNDVLNYDLYSESEWRIVYNERLLNDNRVIDPRNDKFSSHNTYFKSLTATQQETLRYLIPMDGWLSLIIYPNYTIKNLAQQPDSATHKLLKGIKARNHDLGRWVEGGNFPVEMDLDLCRNF